LAVNIVKLKLRGDTYDLRRSMDDRDDDTDTAGIEESRGAVDSGWDIVVRDSSSIEEGVTNNVTGSRRRQIAEGSFDGEL
jgi:hypothetical protein